MLPLLKRIKKRLYGNNTGGALSPAITWVLSALGIATPASTPTYAGPTNHWVANQAGVLTNMGGLKNTLNQNIPPIRGATISGGQVTAAGDAMVFEPLATNLCLQSQDFDNASWNKYTGMAAVATNVTAPDGTATAEKFTWTSGNANRYRFQGFTISAITYTMSVWLQSDSGTVKVGITAVGGPLNDDNVFTATTTWQRFSKTFTGYAGGIDIGIDQRASFVSGVDENGTVNVWGFQLEAQTVSTSYIPTTTGTVSRAATRLQYPVASITALSSVAPWMARFKLTPKELGRDQWIWGDPTSGIGCYLRGSDNKLVYRGASLGSEMVTVAADRNFSSDTGFWEKSADVTIDAANNNRLVCTAAGGLRYIRTAAFFLTADVYYACMFTIDSVSGTGVKASFGNNNSNSYVSSVGTFTQYGKMSDANGQGFLLFATGTTATISAISFKPVLEIATAAVTLNSTNYVGISQSTAGASIYLAGTPTTDATMQTLPTFGTTLDIGSMNNANYLNGELAKAADGNVIEFSSGTDTGWVSSTSW